MSLRTCSAIQRGRVDAWRPSYWLQGSIHRDGEHRQSESGFAGLWRIYRIGMMLRIIVTLTFDSSPIKGEGEYVVVLS